MQFNYTADRSQAPEHQVPGVECAQMHVAGSGDFPDANDCCDYAKRFCIIPGRYTVTATSTGRFASPKYDMKQTFTVKVPR